MTWRLWEGKSAGEEGPARVEEEEVLDGGMGSEKNLAI